MSHSENLEQNDTARVPGVRDTSDCIIEALSCLRNTDDYEASMNRFLEALSGIIHADRLYILEQQRRIDSRVFEHCAKGVPPRLGAIQAVSDDKLAAFTSLFRGRDIVFAETLDDLGVNDPRTIAFFERFGVHSELVVPLRENGRAVGCLGADNYTLPDDIDMKHLLETVAPFLSTVIASQQLLEELEWAGTHDVLTELLNRRGADQALSARLSGNPQEPFALALVDVDDFKLANDLYGHDAGDSALCALADAMRESFPEDSVLARNGGDELLVMLHGKAALRADELIDAFSRRELSYDADGKSVRLSISIGYVSYPDQVDSTARAYKLADMALYAAKLAGKGCALRYSPDMEQENRMQLGFAPRDIAENVPGAIMVHRSGGVRNGEILYANREMVEMLGCESPEDLLAFTGASYRGIIHPDDIERAHAEVDAQVGNRQPGARFSVDYRMVTKSGAVRNVAVNGRLVEAGDIGKAYYVLVIDRDEHRFQHR